MCTPTLCEVTLPNAPKCGCMSMCGMRMQVHVRKQNIMTFKGIQPSNRLISGDYSIMYAEDIEC